MFVALGAFVWLLAPSAFASAPRCDVRAATVLAPTPTLEAPTASIDVGVSDCAPEIELDMLHQGRTAPEVAFSSSPSATLASSVVVVPAARSEKIAPAFESSDAPSGVRTSVERPPR